jgi:uncharacterized protein DUF6572
MSIEQTDRVDFVTIERESGDVWLTISDHLEWDQYEGEHLVLLQDKLNAYLRFIESGEIFEEVPEAKGRNLVINLAGKFPMNELAKRFFEKARAAIRDAGFDLQFHLARSN